jgi:hypothetical protein
MATAATVFWYEPSGLELSVRDWEVAHIKVCLETPSCADQAEALSTEWSLMGTAPNVKAVRGGVE